jgi:hypothetical protein
MVPTGRTVGTVGPVGIRTQQGRPRVEVYRDTQLAYRPHAERQVESI